MSAPPDSPQPPSLTTAARPGRGRGARSEGRCFSRSLAAAHNNNNSNNNGNNMNSLPRPGRPSVGLNSSSSSNNNSNNSCSNVNPRTPESRPGRVNNNAGNNNGNNSNNNGNSNTFNNNNNCSSNCNSSINTNTGNRRNSAIPIVDPNLRKTTPSPRSPTRKGSSSSITSMCINNSNIAATTTNNSNNNNSSSNSNNKNNVNNTGGSVQSVAANNSGSNSNVSSNSDTNQNNSASVMATDNNNSCSNSKSNNCNDNSSNNVLANTNNSACLSFTTPRQPPVVVTTSRGRGTREAGTPRPRLTDRPSRALEIRRPSSPDARPQRGEKLEKPSNPSEEQETNVQEENLTPVATSVSEEAADKETTDVLKNTEIEDTQLTKAVTTNEVEVRAAESTVNGEGTLEFEDPRQNQVLATLKAVQELRASPDYNDLTLRVHGVEFKAHKVVMANASPYFKNLIDGKFDELEKDATKTDDKNVKDDASDGNCNNNNAQIFMNEEIPKNTINDKSKNETSSEAVYDVDVENLTPEIFEKVMDFAYCVFGELPANQALPLLLSADALLMPRLRLTAAHTLASSLAPSNVFQVLRLHDSGCRGLGEQVLAKCHQVLRENFLEISVTSDWLTLPARYVRRLVEDGMLHVLNEASVIQAMLRWVSARPEQRSSEMTLMLQWLRLPLLMKQQLQSLLQEPLLRDNSLAQALIKEAMLYSTLDFESRAAWPRLNCLSRRLMTSRDFLIWTADRDKGLHFWSLIDKAHHKVTTFTPGEAGGKTGQVPIVFDSTSSVCCYDDKIFFSGGEFLTNKLWSVDSTTGIISQLSQMPRGRKFHSFVASRGVLYCLGGQDKRGYTVVDVVDAYIVARDCWVTVGKLAQPAYNMAAVTTGGGAGGGGQIYLLGGEDHTGRPLRIIQVFEWLPPKLYSAYVCPVKGMPPSLFSARAAVAGLDHTVYLVTGDGDVYQFEAEAGKLSHLCSISELRQHPRQRFGLAHVGGRLVVVGGHRLGGQDGEVVNSLCLDIATRTEVRDFGPPLAGDNINTCLAAKLSTHTLNLFL